MDMKLHPSSCISDVRCQKIDPLGNSSSWVCHTDIERIYYSLVGFEVWFQICDADILQIHHLLPQLRLKVIPMVTPSTLSILTPI